MLTTNVTAADIGQRLGRTLDSVETAQVSAWITDTLFLLGQRVDTVDQSQQDAVDYIVTQAVLEVAQAPKPGVSQGSVTVDDATVSESYRPGVAKRVRILPEWWALLGLGRGTAFTIDMAGRDCGSHLPWCSWSMGAAWCSCGVDIAGEPIFEGPLP